MKITAATRMRFVLKLITVFAFQQKMFDNTSLLFYRQSILTSNFASRSSSPFFLSSSLQLIAYSLVSVRICLRANFYATKICIQCRPSFYIFHALTFYIFLIFTNIEFKVSRLISLLYTPNKVLPSFCWNLHLTLVHCHKIQTHTMDF